jgi:hypothetical protein
MGGADIQKTSVSSTISPPAVMGIRVLSAEDGDAYNAFLLKGASYGYIDIRLYRVSTVFRIGYPHP